MTGSASKANQGNTGVSNPTANKAKPSNKRQPYEFKVECDRECSAKALLREELSHG